MGVGNDKYSGHSDLVEFVILENEDKGTQYRFTVSSFRGKEYIGIREWYMGFEGEYAPSNNGVTLPYNLHVTSRLFHSLSTILSEAEVLSEVIKEAHSVEDSGADREVE
jgi:hypothetical protein